MTNPAENDKGATMTQLWAWEYEGKTEFGYETNRGFEGTRRFMRRDSGTSGFMRDTRFITNLRKAKVVDEDLATKTYLTTDQFIKVWKSLDDEKRKEVSAAWSASADWNAARNAAWSAARDADWNATRNAAWSADWSAARNADLAVLAKDEITAEQFEILTSPWTSCGLSLYAEDWG